MKNNKCKNKKSLNIIAHSHGGNVVKQMSNLYDYTQEKTPVVINIATPNRKDYVMNPNIKEYYNVYNVYDTFVQGWAGGSDMPDRKDLTNTPSFVVSKWYQNTLTDIMYNAYKQKNEFHYTKPSQTAREPNAVNVKINYFTLFPRNAHSNFKNLKTMQTLQKEMEKRRNQ